MKRSLFVLCVLSTCVLTSCERADTGLTLVWNDEFDENGTPDAKRWNSEEGFVRNHEAQYYTGMRPENARVEGGVLIIEARKEPYPNSGFDAESENWRAALDSAAYTSAALTTENRASWKYGHIEVRAKLPTGVGTWPAIWMLGTNFRSVGWPECGEIDIMENVGFDPDRVHANIHTEAYNHTQGTGKGSGITVPSPEQDFHSYAVDWDESRMDFSVDDSVYFSYENEGTGTNTWPFDQEFYLILNIAIGGSWGGQQGIDDSIFPQRMEIDYVRVYQ